jgi:hypothetical protein
MKKLFNLYFSAGELGKASDLAERWSARDPLDVEALVARADLKARQGERSKAIRILGSVVDVRPSDYGAQQRLGRLYRWQEQPELACRFSLALAEYRTADERAVADALRRSAGPDRILRAAGKLLAQSQAANELRGDLQLDATFASESGVDVDLSLIDPSGHRISWLGAPTRSVISAAHVTSVREEGLGLRGAKPGEYVLELTRGGGEGAARGTVLVRVAGTQLQIPFKLDGERAALGVIKIAMVPKLVPISRD